MTTRDNRQNINSWLWCSQCTM